MHINPRVFDYWGEFVFRLFYSLKNASNNVLDVKLTVPQISHQPEQSA